jgi:hypothetical protein
LVRQWSGHAVPGPLGRGLRPVKAGGPHDGVHGAPADHVKPADAVDRVAGVEQGSEGTGRHLGVMSRRVYHTDDFLEGVEHAR